MSKNTRIALIFMNLTGLVAMMFAGTMAHSSPSQAQMQANIMPPIHVPAMATPSSSAGSWLVLPVYTTSVDQATIGAEIYRLVCLDCHGDRGQGLTDEWRAAWAPEDQNCWQSKCHASNHPPDGFDLPRYIPALVGPETTARFGTALNLYNYIRINMPWHNPGSLTDEEYRQLAAYLARENNIPALDLPPNDGMTVAESPDMMLAELAQDFSFLDERPRLGCPSRSLSSLVTGV